MFDARYRPALLGALASEKTCFMFRPPIGLKSSSYLRDFQESAIEKHLPKARHDTLQRLYQCHKGNVYNMVFFLSYMVVDNLRTNVKSTEELLQRAKPNLKQQLNLHYPEG